MQPEASPEGQAFAPQQQQHGAGLLREPRRQRHGVGVASEKWRPQPHPLGWNLVWQQPHRMALAQGAQHLAHARQTGRRGVQSRPVTRPCHQPRQPRLPRRAVQDGQWAVSRPVALRQGLGGDLETAQMRRQKDHAASGRIGPVNASRVVPQTRRRFAQPQSGQLGDHPPGAANRSAQAAKTVTGQGAIGEKALSVGP